MTDKLELLYLTDPAAAFAETDHDKNVHVYAGGGLICNTPGLVELKTYRYALAGLCPRCATLAVERRLGEFAHPLDMRDRAMERISPADAIRLLQFVWLAASEGPWTYEGQLIERIQQYASGALPKLATEQNIRHLLYTPLARILGYPA